MTDIYRDFDPNPDWGSQINPVLEEVVTGVDQGQSEITGTTRSYKIEDINEMQSPFPQAERNMGPQALTDVFRMIASPSILMTGETTEGNAYFDPATKESVKEIKENFHFLELHQLSIETYLYLNPNVASVLAQAPEQIHRYFGDDYSLVLCLDKDGEGSICLIFAQIVTSFSPDEALDRLETFEMQWFNSQIASSDGKLSFILAYKD